jgi:hypothetical protein
MRKLILLLRPILDPNNYANRLYKVIYQLSSLFNHNASARDLLSPRAAALLS